MAIAVNDLDIGYRGVTNTTLPQFAGRNRQIVINVDDNYRPVIMDGQTLGGKSKVALLTDLPDLDSLASSGTSQQLGTGSASTAQTKITQDSSSDSNANIELSVKNSTGNTSSLKITPTTITFNSKEFAFKEDLTPLATKESLNSYALISSLGTLASKNEITVNELTGVISLKAINATPKILGQAYGTDAQIASYVGNSSAPGQLVWSSDGHTLYVMDGVKTGGYKVAMADTVDSTYLKKSETAAVANKLGTATVGSATTPIYLNNGVATASTETVGTPDTPVYLNAGVLTSCGKTFVSTEGGQTINGALTLQGTMYATTFQVSSDIRLKSNLATLINPLSVVEQLTGYTYNLKDGPVEERQAGLIAQEIVKAGFIEAVKPRKDGYLTVNYQAITALLVQAVKELSHKVKTLEEKYGK